MLKQGLYTAKNNESMFSAYHIQMQVKETPKSYILELAHFDSRYSGDHIKMLFSNSKKIVLNKERGGHALRAWGDAAFTIYPFQAGIPYYFTMEEAS